MSDIDGIWANEGGIQLVLERVGANVRFSIVQATTEPTHILAHATLEQFRLKRVVDFLTPGIERENAI